MTETRLGVLLFTQAAEWSELEAGARRVDELGYDHLWAWDHLYAIFGDPYQPIFEGYLTLAAWAKVTTRVRLGLLVGAVTFRNPALVAKSLTTLDHLSGGRAIGGSGAPGSTSSTRLRGSTSAPASASGSTGSTRRARRSARCSTVRTSRRPRAATTGWTGSASCRRPSRRTCRS